MPLKVYYLDDESSLLELFADTYSSPDIVITTFEDPVAFVTAVQSEKPDVLILDYRMPNTNGDKIAQILDPAIPKALITGDLAVKTVTQFDAYLEKPLKDEAVEAFLKKYLSLKGS